MAQHYAPYASSTAACGIDMTGRRNSALDGNTAATDCPLCCKVLDDLSAGEEAQDKAAWDSWDR